MIRCLVLCVSTLALWAQPQARVLFVGNSYTLRNDYPTLVQALAQSVDVQLAVATFAADGATLADHAADPALDQALQSHWDVVVFQEQSVLPSQHRWVRSEMVPALRKLRNRIGPHASAFLLSATWGRKNGLQAQGFTSYGDMQAALDSGFASASRSSGMELNPIARAWRQARSLGLTDRLYHQDGSHPSRAGSYLAACVTVNSIGEQLGVRELNVRFATFDGGLDPPLAGQLRDIAVVATSTVRRQ